MKLLLGALPGDGWKVFGLMGKGGRWFLGFSHVFRGNAIDWEQRNAQLRKEVLELDMKNLALDIENERLRKQLAAESAEWVRLPAALTPEMHTAMDWAINDAWHLEQPVSPAAYAAAIGAAPGQPADACRPTANPQEQPKTAGGPP